LLTVTHLSYAYNAMKDSIIDASDYGFKSLNYTKYWVKWPSWRIVGSFVYWGDTLTTNGVNTVKIPFKVERGWKLHYLDTLRICA